MTQTASMDGICEIHRRYCELLPKVLLQVTGTDTSESVRPVLGELRYKDVILANMS